jgi:hypothetical protein
MTEPIGPEAEGSLPSSAAGDNPARTGRRALRRQLLVGGLATTGAMLTLPNRSALAWGGGGQNTCSALASANPSHGVKVTQPCGQPPTCWQSGSGWNAWAPGATCNGKPVSCTHTTTICSHFPQLTTSPFKCSTSYCFGQPTNQSLCFGSVPITVTCGKQNISLWNANQQQEICAAILNDCFFGDLFSSSAITDAISSCLTTVAACAVTGNSSGITTACNNLYNQCYTLNRQGGGSCQI